MSEYDIIKRASFHADYAFIVGDLFFETLLAANFSKPMIQRMLMHAYVRNSTKYQETRRALVRETIDEKFKEHYKHKGTIDHEDYELAVTHLAPITAEVGRFLSHRLYTRDQHGRVALMLEDFLKQMGASDEIAEQARLDVLSERSSDA